MDYKHCLWGVRAVRQAFLFVTVIVTLSIVFLTGSGKYRDNIYKLTSTGGSLEELNDGLESSTIDNNQHDELKYAFKNQWDTNDLVKELKSYNKQFYRRINKKRPSNNRRHTFKSEQSWTDQMQRKVYTSDELFRTLKDNIKRHQLPQYHHYPGFNKRTSKWKKPSRNMTNYLNMIRRKLREPNNKLNHIQEWNGGEDTIDNFCHKFLNETYKNPINICTAKKSKKSVQCFGNSYSREMVACILQNVAIRPTYMASMIHSVIKTRKKKKAPISLLHDADTKCDGMNSVHLENHIEKSSYIYSAIKSLKRSSIPSRLCQKWIQNNVFLFNSNEVHIYFRFLDYFNLHKLLEDYGTNSTQVVHIIRVSEAGFKNYHFPDFDQALFPEASMYTLEKFGQENVCFKRIVTVPRSYGSYPFRCKMSSLLLDQCMHCDGRKLNNNQLTSFRRRVLKACSIEDYDKGSQKGIHNIILISRKIYKRYPGDRPAKFNRVLKNKHKVVRTLRKLFPKATVKVVHMEDYGICQQVKLAHSANLLIGVHGAGLVHLWWLRSSSLVYEIEPFSQSRNPTFSMLAKLTGHRYMQQSIYDSWKGKYYIADVNQMRKDLSGLVINNRDDD